MLHDLTFDHRLIYLFPINASNTMAYHCQPCAGLLTINQVHYYLPQCLDLPMVQKFYFHIYVLHLSTCTIQYTLNHVLCSYIIENNEMFFIHSVKALLTQKAGGNVAIRGFMSTFHPLSVGEGNSGFATNISLFHTTDR